VSSVSFAPLILRSAFILLIVLLSSSIYGQDIRIGIWRDGKVTERFTVRSEQPMVWLTDTGRKVEVAPGRSTYFTFQNGRVRLSTADESFGTFKKVESVESAIDRKFNMASLKPKRTESIYAAELEVNAMGDGLMVLNIHKDIEGYIAGVVESESGKEQGVEFYKVQATISRTYALSNSRRHEHEGFNLCDQVHCQVFHGISRFNPAIIEGTEATRDQVLVDSELQMITASFHSNCGGHTVNSEDVWSLALPYLRAKKDPFCVNGRHANWDAQVASADWHDYIEEQFQVDLEEKPDYSHTYDSLRPAYLLSPELKIERKMLRHKWRLNSTHFEVNDRGEQLHISGKGFGHGVGLCQEGAMNMIFKGYRYDEVVQFYYTDIHLIHRSVIDFFKDN